MQVKPQLKNLVNQIPLGKVTNYGTLAEILGITPVLVGWILSGLSEEESGVWAWQRVVAKDGYISSLKMGSRGLIQKEILISEGCTFVGDKVNMKKHFWADFTFVSGV